MARLWAWLDHPRAAQAAIGVLLLVVVRAIAEFFRIGGSAGVASTPEHIFYLHGAFAAAVAALVVLFLHALGRNRVATTVALAAIAALIVWKVVVLY